MGLAVGGVVVDDRRDLGVGGYLRNTADNDGCERSGSHDVWARDGREIRAP